MADSHSAADRITAHLIARRARHEGVLIAGVCGAQGSGKSYVARAVAERLSALGQVCATLSLDDIYLTHSQRAALARDVHPLLATRGPPGTHAVGLGLPILADLRAGRPVRLPVFDKLADDRAPPDRWTSVSGPVDIVVFEGWCLGAEPQAARDLVAPVNGLERDEDPDGVWRAYVNSALAGEYQTLFDQLDTLVMLKAPSFDIVRQWRTEQEVANAARAPAGSVGVGMNAAQIGRFIQYYERITRHMLANPPRRADLVLALDEARRVIA